MQSVGPAGQQCGSHKLAQVLELSGCQACQLLGNNGGLTSWHSSDGIGAVRRQVCHLGRQCLLLRDAGKQTCRHQGDGLLLLRVLRSARPTMEVKRLGCLMSFAQCSQAEPEVHSSSNWPRLKP